MFYLHDMQLGPSHSVFFPFLFFYFVILITGQISAKKKSKMNQINTRNPKFSPLKTQFFFVERATKFVKRKIASPSNFWVCNYWLMFDIILSCRLQSIFDLIFAI
jgi:hypothetical protein